MDGEEIAGELGRLTEAVRQMESRQAAHDDRLDEHMREEEKRLQTIEQQLSFARFVLFAAKALAMTMVFLLAFKFGDIATLWKALK